MEEQRQRGVLVFATSDPQEAALGDQVLRLGIGPPFDVWYASPEDVIIGKGERIAFH